MTENAKTRKIGQGPVKPVKPPITDVRSTNNTRRLYKLPKAGKVAGVCAGLAVYLGMDATVVRLIFVIITLASGGFGILAYIVLAIVMPADQSEDAGVSGGQDIGDKLHGLADEMAGNGGIVRLRNYVGIGLIVLGLWLLLVQLFPRWVNVDWDYVWPTLLVLIGLLVIVRSRS